MIVFLLLLIFNVIMLDPDNDGYERRQTLTILLDCLWILYKILMVLRNREADLEEGEEERENPAPEAPAPAPEEEVDEGFVDDDQIVDANPNPNPNQEVVQNLNDLAVVEPPPRRRQRFYHRAEWKLRDEQQNVVNEDVDRRRAARMSHQLGHDVVSTLECKVCVKRYCKYTEAIPRVLKCGHTICQKCASTFQKQSPFPNIQINCPFCRKVTYLRNVNKLLKNLALLNVIYTRKFVNNWLWKLIVRITTHDMDYDVIEQALKCPRCFGDYCNHIAARTPRISPVCGHTLCELCIREMVSLYGKFVCRECPTEFHIAVLEGWMRKFPKNYTIMEVLEVM